MDLRPDGIQFLNTASESPTDRRTPHFRMRGRLPELIYGCEEFLRTPVSGARPGAPGTRHVIEIR